MNNDDPRKPLQRGPTALDNSSFLNCASSSSVKGSTESEEGEVETSDETDDVKSVI